MGIPEKILFLVASGVALLSHDVSYSHTVAGDQMALDLRNNVARIKVFGSDGVRQWEENGFGIIVGSRDDRMFIVTANHVVRGDYRNPDVRTDSVLVSFYDDLGSPATSARLLALREPEMDLAVLEVPFPAGVQWQVDCRASVFERERGTNVWSIGLAATWRVPPSAGTISGMTPDERLRVDGLRVQRGSSGGALVGETGLVGMIVSDSPGVESYAIPIDRIESVARNWNLPWQVSYSQDALNAMKPPSAKWVWLSGLTTVGLAASYFVWVEPWNEEREAAHKDDPASDELYDEYETSWRVRNGWIVATSISAFATIVFYAIHRSDVAEHNRKLKLATESYSLHFDALSREIVYTYRF